MATIVFWNFSFDWLGYRYPRFRRLLYPAALLLIKDGRILDRNLRKEFVSREELMSQLRQQGIDDIAKVKEACMEGDGHISVIKK